MARTLVPPVCTSISVADVRARACRCDARACPCISVHERVSSRPPGEGEFSYPITGIGLGVMPVGPHTPRRSSLTTTPPLVPRVPPSTTWSLASGHSRGLANAGNNPTSALEVCGITILGRRPGGTRERLEWRSSGGGGWLGNSVGRAQCHDSTGSLTNRPRILKESPQADIDRRTHHGSLASRWLPGESQARRRGQVDERADVHHRMRASL